MGKIIATEAATCGDRNIVTRDACTLPKGHAGWHSAPCTAKGCGGYGTNHEWPR
jgi:hypothetical protein